MLVAVVMAPLQIWVRGRRWWYLFPPGSNPQGITSAMMIGYMANNVLPLRAGEVVRVYVVASPLQKWSGWGNLVDHDAHEWLVLGFSGFFFQDLLFCGFFFCDSGGGVRAWSGCAWTGGGWA